MGTTRNKNIKDSVLSVTLKIFNMLLKILDGIRNLICWLLENLELFFIAVLFALLFFVMYSAIYYKINETAEEQEKTRHRPSYEIYNAIKQSDREIKVLLIDITNRLERIEREMDKSNKDFEKRELKDA